MNLPEALLALDVAVAQLTDAVSVMAEAIENEGPAVNETFDGPVYLDPNNADRPLRAETERP